MALLVGHGYSEERVLGLTLPCFDALVQCVLRVRKEQLAEWARTTMMATQGSGKALEEWLAPRKNGKTAAPIADGDDLMTALNGAPPGRRRG